MPFIFKFNKATLPTSLTQVSNFIHFVEIIAEAHFRNGLEMREITTIQISQILFIYR